MSMRTSKAQRGATLGGAKTSKRAEPLLPKPLSSRRQPEKNDSRDAPSQSRTKTKTSPISVLKDANDGPVSVTSLAEATHRFNRSLKILTEAVKRRRLNGPVVDAHTKTSYANSSEGRSDAKVFQTTLLQNRSPNRRSNLYSPTPNGEGKNSQRQTREDGNLDGMRDLVGKSRIPRELQTATDLPQSTIDGATESELALIGLDAVESLSRIRQARPSSDSDETLQVEQGSSLLVSKFLSLELNELALTEVYNLGVALSCRISMLSNEVPRDKVKNRREKVEALASLLDVWKACKTTLETSLIIAFRVHVLKVLSREPSRLPTSVLGALCPLNQCSSARFIINSLEAGFIDKQQASQRLHCVSQSLQSLGDSVSSTPSNPELFMLSYKLQAIGLEVRLMQLTIADHKFEMLKDIWKPYIRCLSKLDPVTPSLKKEDVTSIFKSFENLRTTAQGLAQGLAQREDETGSYLAIRAVAEFAERADRIDEALQLYTQILQSSQGGNVAVTARVSCKIAIMTLAQPKVLTTKEALSSLSIMSTTLQRPLKGDAIELDGLITDVVRLRKVAAQCIHDSSTSKDGNTDLRSACTTTIISIVRFFLKYLNAIKAGENSGFVNERIAFKVRPLARHVRQAIDSSLALCRLRSISELQDEWRECERAMADIITLTTLLIPYAGEGTESEALRSVYPKLSNIYCCRLPIATVSEKQALLHKAITVIQDRPIEEWFSAGLAMKYEKLATVLLAEGATSGAVQVYEKAVHASLGPATLKSLMMLTSSGAPRTSWTDYNEYVDQLDRMILAHVRVLVRRSGSATVPARIMCEDNIPSEVQVTLLERYLDCFLRYGVPAHLDKEILNIATQILSFYNTDQYPLRRMRIAWKVLAYHAKHQNFFPASFVDGLADEQVREKLSSGLLGNDESLSDYKICYVTCFQMFAAFHHGRPSIDLVQVTIAAWQSLVASVSDLTTLKARVDDVDGFKSTLNTIIDYTQMQGLGEARLHAMHTLQAVLELIGADCQSDLAPNLVNLGLQYARLGLIGQASTALSCAEPWLSASRNGPATAVQWHLTMVEVLSNIGNQNAAMQAFDGACLVFKQMEPMMDSTSRMARDTLLCFATLIMSQTSAAAGRFDRAIPLAKQGVTISMRLWAALEKIGSPKPNEDSLINDQSMSDSGNPSLIEKFSAMHVTKSELPVSKSGTSVVFWPHLDLHFRSLLNISELASKNGLFQDALYYATHAKKVAQACYADVRLVQVNQMLAHIYVTAGQLDLANESLLLSGERLDASGLDKDTVEQELLAAKISAKAGEVEKALQHLEMTSLALDRYAKELRKMSKTTPFTPCRERNRSPVKIGKQARGKGKIGARAGVEAKASTQSFECEPAGDFGASKFGGLLSMTKGPLFADLSKQLLSQNIEILLSDGRRPQILSVPGHEGLSMDDLPLVAKISVHCFDAMNGLSDDSVYSLLMESPVSWPSREAQDATKAQVDKTVGVKAQKTRSKRGKGSVRKQEQTRAPHRLDLAPEADCLLYMWKLQDMLKEKGLLFSGCHSTTDISFLAEMEIKVNLMLSAIGSSPTNYCDRVLDISSLPRIVAMSREANAIKADKALEDKTRLLEWPCISDSDPMPARDTLVEYPCLTAEVIEKLPASWAVISIHLSRDQKELLLTKTFCNRQPFVLRLPIRRTSEEDESSEVFDSDTCKLELADIIALANSTAHDAGGRSNKQLKKEWWAQRQALDQRLGCLLDNIENIWLGGFRGILSHHRADDASLLRFARSMARVLDEHLPSRQKANSAAHCKIHVAVLELFIGLGDPDDADLDDAVADLLSFVVDILQFSGERNAYDEVDFDVMAVETIDALRTYHNSVTDQPEQEAVPHTILILDKNLLGIPWESLPCLRGKSVSRLPSMRCLQMRLEQIHQQTANSRGLFIDATDGAYILNPSEDLAATESTFSKTLSSSLPAFNGITGRKPTEAEFTSSLDSHSLCLYFGHGSGAQYIRGRTIKRLDRCAVTFLMGCSSAAMHEAGEYEPYGVPWNYSHAGSPAVVGTLWDVTDKDIDRFAMRTLVNWGLLEPECWKQQKQNPKGKKRMEAVATEDVFGGAAARGVVDLGQAVAGARDACFLRYLNGAAPVIYGIPVFLQ